MFCNSSKIGGVILTGTLIETVKEHLKEDPFMSKP